MGDIWRHFVVLEVLREKRVSLMSEFRTAVQNGDILQETALGERLIEVNRAILKIKEEEKKTVSVSGETSFLPASSDTDNNQRKRPPEPVTQPVVPRKAIKHSHVQANDGSSHSFQSDVAISMATMDVEQRTSVKQVQSSSESMQSFILANPMPNSDTSCIEADATSHTGESEMGGFDVVSPDTSSPSPAIIEEEETGSTLGNETWDEEVDGMSLDPGIILPCFKRRSCTVLRNDESVLRVVDSVILSEHESDIVRQGVNEIDRAHEFLKIAFGYGREISTEDLIKADKYQAMLQLLKSNGPGQCASDYFSYVMRPNKKTLRSRGFLNVYLILWDNEREAISVTCYKIFDKQTLREKTTESNTTSQFGSYYGGTIHKCRCTFCINTCDARGQKVLQVNGRCDECHKANNAVPQYSWQQSRAMACDLDPSVFKQCKEMIRPVKNVLDHLDPDPDSNVKDQVEQTMSSVITIGRRIDSCVQNFENKKRKKWIRYLWCFVSKFTNFEGTQLYKVYRKAVKKGNLHSE